MGPLILEMWSFSIYLYYICPSCILQEHIRGQPEDTTWDGQESSLYI